MSAKRKITSPHNYEKILLRMQQDFYAVRDT
jgi:hypothetical protein